MAISRSHWAKKGAFGQKNPIRGHKSIDPGPMFSIFALNRDENWIFAADAKHDILSRVHGGSIWKRDLDTYRLFNGGRCNIRRLPSTPRISPVNIYYKSGRFQNFRAIEYLSWPRQLTKWASITLNNGIACLPERALLQMIYERTLFLYVVAPQWRSGGRGRCHCWNTRNTHRNTLIYERFCTQGSIRFPKVC